MPGLFRQGGFLDGLQPESSFLGIRHREGGAPSDVPHDRGEPVLDVPQVWCNVAWSGLVWCGRAG